MEELTKRKKGRLGHFLVDLVVNEYENTSSPAFGKSSNVVRDILLRKFPQEKKNLTPSFVRNALERHSTTYATTRIVQTARKKRQFDGTSFYSRHPHHRWHVDLQDMTIFKRAGKLSKKGTTYSFMLVCVDDFSNFLMVELLPNKRAITVLNGIIKVIQRVHAVPIIVYCDKGSEFDNKLFKDKETNGFRVQFTIDRRKAVYAERAIRTIRRGLQQYFILRPRDNDIKKAVKTVVRSHNHTPSRRGPARKDGSRSTPFEIITEPSLMDGMEDILKQRRLLQYVANVRKKVISPRPLFEVGSLVRYLLRREAFTKEASLTGSWTSEIYRVLKVHKAHAMKPMHTYTLAELNSTVAVPSLPPLPENQLKKAFINPKQTFPIEKVLKRRKNKVLIKWQGYSVPTWESKKNVVPLG